MSEYLTAQELHQLTGYARSGQQADYLRQHGLPFKQDGGRIIVSRVHVQSWLEGKLERVWTERDMHAFAAQRVDAERERCAKLCDQSDKSTHPADLADAIRRA